MVTIDYGTLPTRSYLAIRYRASGYKGDGRWLYDDLRDMLRRHGPCPYVHGWLQALGIAWRDTPLIPDAEMQEAVDSVAAAIGDEP